MEGRILIIGGGPVGLALAVALARYKIKSIVIEKRTEPTPVEESRAIVWMPKGIEFLKWIGLLEEFKKHSVQRTVHRFTLHGKKLMDIDLSLANSEFGYSLHLPQYYSEYLFEEEARKNKEFVTILRGYEFISLEQSDHDVSVLVKNNETLQDEVLIGNYAVGCDGAKSTTRELLAIKNTWDDYGTFSGVADIEADIPDESAQASWIELDRKRAVGLFGFHPRKWRITYRVNEGETKQQASTHTFVDQIIKKHFPNIKTYKILWVSVFRLGQGQSERYFDKRIVLAGDAAHPMGPSAGAGMMVGMLGVWRLAFRMRNIINETNKKVIHKVLSQYQHDQVSGSQSIQQANAATFSQIAVTSWLAGWIRTLILKAIAGILFIRRKIVIAETLTNQNVHYEDYR